MEEFSIKIPTPHIGAENKEQIAKTVLMPGDPLRAKFVAEHFLENPVLYNNVRGMLGYTGMYKGKKVSVQGSGMGMPSIGLYSYELYAGYGVENIIRIGTACSVNPELNVRDIAVAMGACTNSNFQNQYALEGNYSAIADYKLMRTAIDRLEEKKLKYKVGNVISSDIFYYDDYALADSWSKMHVLAAEMEAAALYMTAARLGRRALCLLTISDNAITGECTTSKERETSFTGMIETALDTAASMD